MRHFQAIAAQSPPSGDRCCVGDESDTEASRMLGQIPYRTADDRFRLGWQPIVSMFCLRPAPPFEREVGGILPVSVFLLISRAPNHVGQANRENQQPTQGKSESHHE